MKKQKLFNVQYIPDMRELVKQAKAKFEKSIAFKQFDENRNIEEYTFGQCADDINALGTALTARGLVGKHFAIIGESSYQWIVSYLSVACGTGVTVPLEKDLPAHDIVKLIKKADVEVVFFSRTLLEDMDQILSLCPEITMAVCLNPQDGDNGYLSLNALIDEGKKLLLEGDTRFLNASIDPDKMAVIIFTSGTTGANKGVMLSHTNIMTSLHSAFTMQRFPDLGFSVLPINHTYEFNLNILGIFYYGITMCINDSLKHVVENLNTFHPKFSLMVPLIVENMYKKIWSEAEKSGLDAHLRYGIWFSNLLRKFGIDKRKRFFKPVLEKFGGQLHLIVSGGAPLRAEVVKGMDDIGISVYNGYGTTECSPLIAFNSELLNIPGSVGRPIPAVQIRIDQPDEMGIGEIQVKGKNVMLGFYKDEEATKATFTEDGWLKTGDLGRVGRKGVLQITGREKNLIILANGKNVHPEEVEDYLMSHIPYLKEVMVFAPSEASAEIGLISVEAYLEPEFVEEHGEAEALKMLEADVRRCNRQLASYKRVNKIHMRLCEFEKTTTKKIKRYIALEEIRKNV